MGMFGKVVIAGVSLIACFTGVAIAAGNSGSDHHDHQGIVGGTPDPATSLPIDQANAVRSARAYLAVGAFSRTELIRQLVTGDHYASTSAAKAVDSLRLDYDAEAGKAAKNYLKMSGFSRVALIRQLVAGDGYTADQAAHGATAAGL